MDSYFRQCRDRKVDFESTTWNVRMATVPPRLPGEDDDDDQSIQATFNFYCLHMYRNWILRQDSTDLEFLNEVESENFVAKSIQYESEKTTHCKKKIHRIVFGWLRDFSMPSWSEWYDLATVISDAWDSIVDRLPRGRNSLNVDFGFAIVHEHILDENLAIHRATQRSMQQVLEPAMVPATDASIKSLKSKVIDSSSGEDHGSCRICLEDFEAAGCEQVVIMPCSHIFHMDCIEKWLKASHYCPICRYQMPTN